MITRQAICIEFADGQRLYSPDVEVGEDAEGRTTLLPVEPFREIAEAKQQSERSDFYPARDPEANNPLPSMLDQLEARMTQSERPEVER